MTSCVPDLFAVGVAYQQPVSLVLISNSLKLTDRTLQYLLIKLLLSLNTNNQDGDVMDCRCQSITLT